MWLSGYSDGIKTAAAFIHGAEPANKLLQQSVLDLQPSNKLTPTEMALGMNHFYQDTPENAGVPLVGAMRYVERKASGATQSDLDEFAAGLRKAAASPEKNR